MQYVGKTRKRAKTRQLSKGNGNIEGEILNSSPLGQQKVAMKSKRCQRDWTGEKSTKWHQHKKGGDEEQKRKEQAGKIQQMLRDENEHGNQWKVYQH
jgi:hypothetical protein